MKSLQVERQKISETISSLPSRAPRTPAVPPQYPALVLSSPWFAFAHLIHAAPENFFSPKFS
jgi:hypothetical protein